LEADGWTNIDFEVPVVTSWPARPYSGVEITDVEILY